MKNTLTTIIILLCSFLCLPYLVRQAYAANKSQVLIINQVRGEECCDKGNFENLKRQIETAIDLKVPSTFAIRYDALKNKKYSDYLEEKANKFPNIISLGIILENTPNFVKESGVKYRGTNETWFGAENLFSIGYTEDENKKMADNIFSIFKNRFNYYPKITSSWMINTSLLNYIHDKYGVEIHQITREQWGTDSYTLDGGPPHYPYPAGKNWLFNPDFQRQNAPIVVRQTVEDPLFNYGDKTSSYTSQPNDYMKNKKFDYFKSLLDQALFDQGQTGFALLGLENSMGKEFQDEFIEQLKIISDYMEHNLIDIPGPDEINSYWSNNKITIYKGSNFAEDTSNFAYWITTPNYRVRLRIANEKVSFSDIRIYNSEFSDTYKNKLAEREGFWIVPFLLNSSINKKDEENIFPLISQPMPINNFLTINNDSGNNESKISLPNISNGLNVQNTDKGVILEYQSGNKKIILNFKENKITTSGINAKDFLYPNNSLPFSPIEYLNNPTGFSLTWKTEGATLEKAEAKCKKDCEITFTSYPEILDKSRKVDYEYLFPEPSNHNTDSNKTVFYANNQYAIAERNPIRVIVIPYDRYGIVTTLSKSTKVVSKDNLKTKFTQQGKRYFFDFYSDTPKSETVIINFGTTQKNINVYFAPNCKREIKTCISNPKFLWWYANTILGDKFRQIFYKEK